MATSNFIDIEKEKIIADAIIGDQSSVDRLRFSPWFTEFVDRVSIRDSNRYSLDREEVRDAIFDRVSEKIHDITNPKNNPLTGCFCRWCLTIARSCCLNMIRRNDLNNAYLDDLKALEKTHGSRISTDGFSTPLQFSSTDSPEEIAIESELGKLCENLRVAIYLTVRRELTASSPIDIRVVILWGAGNMNLKQISDMTGASISTVQRHLTNWQKGILRQTILQQFVDQEPGRRAGAYEMFRNAIKEFTQAA
ncbi:MAG TPA: hypothetical protein VFI24_10180 [Pyrinomonadaceae bacterium]|nr:hypothetical protein [Pyrinomonadaceae bacterium]